MKLKKQDEGFTFAETVIVLIIILFIILLILEFIFIISIGNFGIIFGHKHNDKKFLNSVKKV